MENRDYQKIAKVVAHKKFGKVWELEKGQRIFETNGNQYAIRSSNSFFLAENYPSFTELFYNDFSNSFVLVSKKNENSIVVATVKAERGIKIWDTQNGPLKHLLENKQLVLKTGSDIYDANNYELGKIFVVDKLSMTTMVVGDEFKVALMLDDGDKKSYKSIVKMDFSEEETLKTQLMHVDGEKTAVEHQNIAEAAKVKELIENLISEGVEPANIGITSQFKSQLALYEAILKQLLPKENILQANLISKSKNFDYLIYSISVFDGNALLLKSAHTIIKKLLKQAETFIIAGNIEFLLEKNQHLEKLLQNAYENGQVIEL